MANAKTVLKEAQKILPETFAAVNDGGGFFSLYIKKAPDSCGTNELNRLYLAFRKCETFDAVKGVRGTTELGFAWRQFKYWG